MAARQQFVDAMVLDRDIGPIVYSGWRRNRESRCDAVRGPDPNECSYRRRRSFILLVRSNRQIQVGLRRLVPFEVSIDTIHAHYR